jgi:MazG family protein
MEPPRTFDHLVAIMDRLREPGGCPWDREQTYETLRGFLLEEAYEVAEAIDAGVPGDLCEELGDLLFQVVFLARLAKEQGAFEAADVIEGIAAKMVRRHPHVFADETAATTQEVLRKWEEIKRREKAASGDGEPASFPSVLDGVPRALPALLKAQRLGDKAARVGFDWPDAASVLDKVDEEAAELRAAVAAGERTRVSEEIGDVLFSVAMLARRLGIDPEGALEGANRKFRSRFGHVEGSLRSLGVAVESAGIEVLERLWHEAKAAENT